MNLSDFVDVDGLEEALSPPDIKVFGAWTETAHQICPTLHKEIAGLLVIYSEIPKQELRTSQIMSFIDALVRLMPSADAKKSLLQAEAFQFLKKD